MNATWITRKILFNSDFISALKRSVPSDKLHWDKEDKVWHFHPDYKNRVDSLIRRYFTVRDGITWLDAWDILYLRQGAPIRLVEYVSSWLIANEPSEDRRKKIEIAKEMLLEL